MSEPYGHEFRESLALEEYKSLRAESADAKRNQQSIFQWSMATAGVIVAGSVAVTRNTTSSSNSNGYVAAGLSLLIVVPVIMSCALGAWLGEVQRMERVGRYLRNREFLAMAGDNVQLHDPKAESSYSIQWESLLTDRASLRFYGKNRLGSAAACALYTIFFFGSLATGVAITTDSPASKIVGPGWTQILIAATIIAAISFASTLMRTAVRLALRSSTPAAIPPTPAVSTLECDVVLPCLDEQEAVEWVLARVPPVANRFLVNDGSEDLSPELAAAMGATVVDNPEPRGVGRASDFGITLGGSEVICIFDCDGTFDPRWIPDLVAPIRDGTCDLVVGERDLKTPGWSISHRVASKIRIRLVRRRFRDFPLSDIGSARAIRRSVVEAGRLNLEKTNAWSLDLTLKVLKDCGPHRIGKVRVPYLARIGKSKVTGTVHGAIRTAVASIRAIRRTTPERTEPADDDDTRAPV